jgi:flagellar hook-length control protein FliK
LINNYSGISLALPKGMNILMNDISIMAKTPGPDNRNDLASCAKPNSSSSTFDSFISDISNSTDSTPKQDPVSSEVQQSDQKSNGSSSDMNTDHVSEKDRADNQITGDRLNDTEQSEYPQSDNPETEPSSEGSLKVEAFLCNLIGDCVSETKVSTANITGNGEAASEADLLSQLNQLDHKESKEKETEKNVLITTPEEGDAEIESALTAKQELFKSGSGKEVNNNEVAKKHPPDKSELKGHDVKKVEFIQPENEIEDPNLMGNQKNARNLNNRLFPEFIKDIDRINNIRDIQGEGTRTTPLKGHGSRDIDPSGIINNVDTVSKSISSGTGLYKGLAARPAGFNEVLDNIVYIVKGNNRLGITLQHDTFGKLNINLSLDKGIVNVHINTSDKVLREFIENNIQYIVDSLEKEGISIGGFSIGLRDHKDPDEKMIIEDSNSDYREYIKKPEYIVNNRTLVNIFV